MDMNFAEMSIPDLTNLFWDWLKKDAADIGDPDSEYYEWPLVPDAPKEAVDAYKYFLKIKTDARRNGMIID